MLQNGLVGRGTRPVDQRISGRPVPSPGDFPLEEEISEGFSELATHATVDSKIDWIAEHNQEVDEQDGRVEVIVVGDTQIQGILHDMEECGHGHWYLDHKKDSDHNNQHEGGAIAVPQLLAFALPVLLEELVPLQLCLSQSRKQ